MYLMVHKEMGWLAEGLATLSTGTKLRSKVTVSVVLQVHLGPELLITVVTLEPAPLQNLYCLLSQDQTCLLNSNCEETQKLKV